jgi:hypothetical protein
MSDIILLVIKNLLGLEGLISKEKIELITGRREEMGERLEKELMKLEQKEGKEKEG